MKRFSKSYVFGINLSAERIVASLHHHLVVQVKHIQKFCTFVSLAYKSSYHCTIIRLRELRFGLFISWSLSHTNPHIIAPSLGCTSHPFHTISWSLVYKSSQHCTIIRLHESCIGLSISWSDSLTYKSSAYQCTIIWLHEPHISYHQLLSRVQILASLHHHLATRVTHFKFRIFVPLRIEDNVGVDPSKDIIFWH